MTSLTSSPIVYLSRRAWQYAAGHRVSIGLCTALFLGAQALSFAQPYVVGRLLSAVQTHASAADLKAEFYGCALAYLGIELGFYLLHGPARVLERYVAFQIRARFKSELFHAGTQLPLQWHRDNHSGDAIDRINRAAAGLYEFSANASAVLYMLLRLFGAELILLWFMPFAGAAAILTTLPVIALIFLFDEWLGRQYDTLNQRENEVATALHDYFTNMVTVITLRLDARVLAEVRRRIALPLSLFVRNNALNEAKWFTTNTLITLMIVVVLVAHARSQMASGGVILAGTLFMLYDYLRRIGDAFYSFAGLYGTLGRQAADVRGVEPIEQAFGQLVRHDDAPPLPADWKVIDVTNVGFRYPDEQQRPNLTNARVRLARGSSVAFVGPSGSGKSTMLTVLRGLVEPACASFVCDGAPVDRRSVARSTTLMGQVPEIFADTLRFNITFGLPADDEAIQAAARVACFDTVLERLPDGLDADIAEAGVNLSGGEKQRLALARGVFFSRESQIVLMDEPTSSVDGPNEKRIYSNFFEMYKDRCMVSSIHRLHLLPMFDRVYVFQEGRMVEDGTFAELLEKNGLLARMWADYQAADGEPEPLLGMS